MGFFNPESTGRASQNIDEILRENMEATHGERLAREGSIGPIDEPVMSNEDIIDMVSGFGTTGRLGKEFFTGGSAMRAIKSKLQHYRDWRYLNPENPYESGKGLMSFRDYLKGVSKNHPKSVKEYNALNKANKERLTAEKALNKHGIPHNPIEKTDLALRRDPISFLLAKLKESRKSDF